MFRSLLTGLLAAGVALSANLAGTPAQDKQDPPKKRERIALLEPKDAAKDPDFAIQGEYVGAVVSTDEKKTKIGAQVIAKGLGEFGAKVYTGGLPGEGWDGKAPLTGSGKISGLDGAAEITGKDLTALVGGGNFSFRDNGNEKFNGTLKKVERRSKTLGAKPPQDAVVLWAAAGDEKNWDGGRLSDLSDGKFLSVDKRADKSGGDLRSKEKFGAFQAHVEFRLPWMPNSREQGRGNSGVYLQDRYECQVLDSFGLNGEDNECGGIYQQYKPSVNMCLPPMVWQTYDIEFTPAEFDSGGKKTKPARATIHHNGVKIHDNVELKGSTGGGVAETRDPGSLRLQDHGDPVVYRNIWVVPVK